MLLPKFPFTIYNIPIFGDVEYLLISYCAQSFLTFHLLQLYKSLQDNYNNIGNFFGNGDPIIIIKLDQIGDTFIKISWYENDFMYNSLIRLSKSYKLQNHELSKLIIEKHYQDTFFIIEYITNIYKSLIKKVLPDQFFGELKSFIIQINDITIGECQPEQQSVEIKELPYNCNSSIKVIMELTNGLKYDSNQLKFKTLSKRSETSSEIGFHNNIEGQVQQQVQVQENEFDTTLYTEAAIDLQINSLRLNIPQLKQDIIELKNNLKKLELENEEKENELKEELNLLKLEKKCIHDNSIKKQIRILEEKKLQNENIKSNLELNIKSDELNIKDKKLLIENKIDLIKSLKYDNENIDKRNFLQLKKFQDIKLNLKHELEMERENEIVSDTSINDPSMNDNKECNKLMIPIKNIEKKIELQKQSIKSISYHNEELETIIKKLLLDYKDINEFKKDNELEFQYYRLKKELEKYNIELLILEKEMSNENRNKLDLLQKLTNLRRNNEEREIFNDYPKPDQSPIIKYKTSPIPTRSKPKSISITNSKPFREEPLTSFNATSFFHNYDVRGNKRGSIEFIEMPNILSSSPNNNNNNHMYYNSQSYSSSSSSQQRIISTSLERNSSIGSNKSRTNHYDEFLESLTFDL
jgi:hypothetical protein